MRSFFCCCLMPLWLACLPFVTRVREDPVFAKYGDDLLLVYPNMNRQQIQDMLFENWSRPYVYADFTHFAERPFQGEYVNVTAAGYRKSADQGPWPPQDDAVNVFVFGGSTTFGYGLPDEQTLASCLQASLQRYSARPVRVYNFGVGWYFSTQERLLLEKLLVQGHVPDIAVFVDGLNDTTSAHNNRPPFSESDG